MKKKLVLFTLIAAITLASCALGASPEELALRRIDQTLEVLGASDAQSLGQMEHLTNRDNSLMYYGNGMYYYFEPNSGQLAQIRHETLVDVDAPDLVKGKEELSEEDRNRQAMELAEKCLKGQTFGELVIRYNKFNGVYFMYIIREVYEGLHTGTSVMIQMYPDGTVVTCDVVIGTLFEKKFNGKYELIGGEDFIESEQAVEAAVAYLRENDVGISAGSLLMDTVECSLTTSADRMTYRVRIQYMDGDITKQYTAQVDVYSGEVLAALDCV